MDVVYVVDLFDDQTVDTDVAVSFEDGVVVVTDQHS